PEQARAVAAVGELVFFRPSLRVAERCEQRVIKLRRRFEIAHAKREMVEHEILRTTLDWGASPLTQACAKKISVRSENSEVEMWIVLFCNDPGDTPHVLRKRRNIPQAA